MGKNSIILFTVCHIFGTYIFTNPLSAEAGRSGLTGENVMYIKLCIHIVHIVSLRAEILENFVSKLGWLTRKEAGKYSGLMGPQE